MIDPAADHLVYVVADLDSAAREMEDRLGVPFTPGGSHPGLGTRNVLLRIGPRVYLELLGPDPEQPRPTGGLWLAAKGPIRPALATWCVRAGDLDGLATGSAGHLVGPVRSMSRATPGGDRIAWTLTMPLTPPARGGIVPFFIDWGETTHPCHDLPDHGVRLVALRGSHPDPQSVRADLEALGVELAVARGPRALHAELETPAGRIRPVLAGHSRRAGSSTCA